MDVGALPDLDRLDNEALKALVVEQREQHLKALSSKTQQDAPGPDSGTWETTTPPLPLAQNYAPPAHNGDSETPERNRRRGSSCVRVRRINLSGTCPIRTC
jgi:hypothetical protein